MLKVNIFDVLSFEAEAISFRHAFAKDALKKDRQITLISHVQQTYFWQSEFPLVPNVVIYLRTSVMLKPADK